MKNSINRRQFLKLLSLLAIAGFSHKLPDDSVRKSAESTLNPSKPNVLVLVYDTFSANHCSLYGYPRKTTPNLEKIAEKALVYHRHYATGNFTSPGTASLLTGLYPWTHHCYHLHGTVSENFNNHTIFSSLAPTYYNFAYTHNPQAAILLKQFGNSIDKLTKISELCVASHSYADQFLSQDFNLAYDVELLTIRNRNHPPSSLFLSILEKIRRVVTDFEVNRRLRDQFPMGVPNFFDEDRPSFLYFTLEQATDWIIEQTKIIPQPFLGYVHVLPPHGPYTPPTKTIDMFDDDYVPINKPEHLFTEGYDFETLRSNRQRYDEYVAYVDAEIGRLIATLESNGTLENTIVFITSDHGEIFERGMLAHFNKLLYEPLIRIPLIVLVPEHEKRLDINSLTSNVDLLPTIAYLAGSVAPSSIEGNVLPRITGILPPTDRAVFALEAKENSKFTPIVTATAAMLQNQYKLISYLGYPGVDDYFELYDLVNDPEELENLIQTKPEIYEEMKTKLLSQMNYQSSR